MSIDRPIELRPLGVFNANSRLSGVVAVYDAETNRYITEVDCTNWSALKPREKAIDYLAIATERPVEIITRAINEMMVQARTAQTEAENTQANAPRPAPRTHDKPTIKVKGGILTDPSTDTPRSAQVGF